MIVKKNLITLAIAASVAPSVYSDIEYARGEIEESVITSARVSIPLRESLPTTHVISHEQIRLSGARDLGSVLGRVSGLDFRDSGGRGSANGVFVRGNAPSATLILIDGVRSASATLGSTDLNNIPLEVIERIEIVTSPISSLYGADAVGGAINIITKKATTNGFAGATEVGFGSNALQDYGLSASYGNDAHQFGASVNYEDTDGIDRTLNTTDGNGDEDGFDQLNLSLSANLRLSDTTSARLSYLYSDSTTEFDNPFGVDGGQFTDNQLQKFSSSVTQNIGEDLVVNYNLGYFQDESVTPAPSAFPSDITTERLTLGVNANWIYSEDTILVGGVEYYDDDVETLSNFPETQRDNLGVFGQFLYKPSAFNGIANIR